MMSNRGVIGKFKQNTDFGGRLGSQEAYLLSAGGFYPLFVAATSSSALISDSSHTVFLAKASGNDGTNTTFDDDVDADRTITVGGDISAQAFTPFHPGGYSAYFDGSGDYLAVPDDDASFDFGAPADGDFTIEGWLYPTALGDYDTVLTQTGTWAIEILNSKLTLWLDTGTGGSWGILNGQAISKVLQTDEWVHFALVRNGSTLTSYINGISEYSATVSGHIGNSSNNVQIGYYSSSGHEWNGYMRDIRIVKGTAVYTGNFTPPTGPLTTSGGEYPSSSNITNPTASETSLLACHLPYLADGSSNDHTITFAGNVALERFSPYDHIAYDPATHGASVYNDGTGDYMSVPADTTNLTMSGDFTIDFWYYPVAAKTNGFVYGKWANNSDGWVIFVTPNYSSGNFGYVSFYYGNYGSNESATNLRSTVVTLNQWHYIRITRSSNTIYMSVNGKVGTRTSYSSGIDFTDDRTFNADTTIGIAGNSIGYTLGQAYLSDLRVINGTALTTGNFTPPTSPATAVTDTKLLTCNDAPNIYNASGSDNSIALGGDAKSSTAQTKYASASMYFDGTGDWIKTESVSDFNLNNVDFTIEGWFYATAPAGNEHIWSSYIDASNRESLYFTNSTTLNWWVNGSNRISATVAANTWYHVAIVKTNYITTMFIDGTSQGTWQGTYTDGNRLVWLGTYNDGGVASDSFTGYLSDWRFTKGLSRYPFIPAAETLTSGTLTKALACHAASETTAVYGADSDSLDVTKNGNVSISDFGPGPGMKSCYFDGNDDWLTIDLGSSIGTSDFCVEGWAYRDASSGTSNSRGIFSISDDTNGWSSSSSNISLQYRNSASGNEWAAFLANAQRNITDTDTVMSKWYHFVVQRNGGTSYVFIDGAMIYSVADTYDYSGKQYLAIGTYHSDDDWYGYISNLRVSVGSGSNFYANSFTVPAAELTA